MSATPCPKASLVEARRDGRLGPRESASIERHLRDCAECGALARDLDRLGALAAMVPPSAAPLDVARRRSRLIREAALRLPDTRRARLPVRAALALGAIVLGSVAFAGWRAFAPRSSGPAAQRREATTVRAEVGARYERDVSDGIEIVRLAAGALEIAVHHLGEGERFVVRTDDAEVEVRGTVFRVEASDGHLVAVDDAEGAVEVRAPSGTILLEPGASWRAPRRTELAAPPARATAEATASAAAARAPTARAQAASNTAPARAAKPEHDGAFARGIERMERGDYEGALASFDDFRRDDRADPRLEDAAYLVAIVLQRAGRPDEAAAAARAYLRDYPAGFHRAGALAIADLSGIDGGATKER